METHHQPRPLPPSGAGRRVANSALIAGLVTALSVSGAGALFLWLLREDRQAEVSQEGTARPVVIVSPTEADPVEAVNPESESAVALPPSPVALGPVPTEIVKSLVRGVMARDANSVRNLLGDRVSSAQLAAFLTAVQEAAVKLDREQPVTDLGRSGFVERWAVNLLRPGVAEKYPLVLHFRQEAAGEWIIAEVRLPKELGIGAEESGPALARAGAFVNKLATLEFADLADFVIADTVPNEKLAALGIIFDEAQFQPQRTGSLRATHVTDDRAWVIARVRSDAYDVDSEFGLELKKIGEKWLVERINLSRLMREFTAMAPGEDAHNPPLVNTPAGGDSIVLYFGYDDEKLTPRSLKQLAVVASLLKNSAQKRIQIGGHADSHGDDRYNDTLSKQRADRVAEALRSLGVPGSQVQLEGFGERHPLSPNLNPDGSDNPQGRERNRRAEIYLDF